MLMVWSHRRPLTSSRDQRITPLELSRFSPTQLVDRGPPDFSAPSSGPECSQRAVQRIHKRLDRLFDGGRVGVDVIAV